MIQIYMTDETGCIDDDLNKLIEKTVRACIKSESYEKSTEVSILIVGKEKIRQINKEFRGIDKETDVLSFPMLDFTENSSLGDIVINIERARQQASDYEHSFERELAFLVVHSMLHLFDYDHESKEDEQIMFTKQDEILNGLGLVR